MVVIVPFILWVIWGLLVWVFYSLYNFVEDFCEVSLIFSLHDALCDVQKTQNKNCLLATATTQTQTDTGTDWKDYLQEGTDSDSWNRGPKTQGVWLTEFKSWFVLS